MTNYVGSIQAQQERGTTMQWQTIGDWSSSSKRIGSSKILPGDRSLCHLEILPPNPSSGRTKEGRGWKVSAWHKDHFWDQRATSTCRKAVAICSPENQLFFSALLLFAEGRSA